MKEFDRLYSSGELVHENNPVLRWAMSNVVCVVDPAENIKPDKKKSAEKIDPVVASINAIAVSIDLPEEEEGDAPQIFVY
jgi:phage terminase large subunit-like protein